MKFDKSKMDCENCLIKKEMELCLCETCPEEDTCGYEDCYEGVFAELDEYVICQENEEEKEE